MSKKNEINEYWSKFYQSDNAQIDLNGPSDFSKFVLNEIKKNNIKNIIEFGCGNGRDSLFFIENQIYVFAFDKCEQAINAIQKKCGKNKYLQLKIMDIVSDGFPEQLIEISPKIIYARFFLHALDDEAIDIFIRKSSKSMAPGDMMFVEYRTIKDLNRKKFTDEHYRNYLDPKNIVNFAEKKDLQCTYEVEGTGMAIWKDDNAHVARQIFVKI